MHLQTLSFFFFFYIGTLWSLFASFSFYVASRRRLKHSGSGLSIGLFSSRQEPLRAHFKLEENDCVFERTKEKKKTAHQLRVVPHVISSPLLPGPSSFGSLRSWHSRALTQTLPRCVTAACQGQKVLFHLREVSPLEWISHLWPRWDSWPACKTWTTDGFVPDWSRLREKCFCR